MSVISFKNKAKIGKNIFQMEQEKDLKIESAEELEAEKQHLVEVKEDDIRTQIISDYGFDPDNDKERIDKLVQKEVSYKKSLSTAIGQKRKYRDEYTKLSSSKVDKGAINFKPEDLDKHVQQAIDKRELESLEYPDDVKNAIKRAAELDGVSYRKAMSDPYVAAKIEAYNKKKEAEEAALGRSDKSSKSKNTDPFTPPDVDLNTEEGRKEYDTWKSNMIKEGH